VARRAPIILACAEGADGKVVARRLHVTPGTVCKWRGRFLMQRLDGLYDEPRPGGKRTIADAQVEDVIVRTVETAPCGAMALEYRRHGEGGWSESHRHQPDWHTFDLQPATQRDVQAVERPALLIEKVRDIVGLYLNPPAHAAVFCVDEKPQI
jgi:transposase